MMKLRVDGRIFSVTAEGNALGESIRAMCPFTLSMPRSGNHEYYAALPQKPDLQGAVETKRVKSGGIYYFEAWNAISLVFRDTNIAPYSVFVAGKADDAIISFLESADRQIEITWGYKQCRHSN